MARLLGAAMLIVAASANGSCCKKCDLPLVKYYSVDVAHGFCGEACMDPKKFFLYKKFEANLTLVDDKNPGCSGQYAPDGTHYTDYDSTVTHGDPLKILSVTLDLYAPTGMPVHTCCTTPLPIVGPLMCIHKPKKMTIRGTGPYCCPADATEEEPCKKETAIIKEPAKEVTTDELLAIKEPAKEATTDELLAIKDPAKEVITDELPGTCAKTGVCGLVYQACCAGFVAKGYPCGCHLKDGNGTSTSDCGTCGSVYSICCAGYAAKGYPCTCDIGVGGQSSLVV